MTKLLNRPLKAFALYSLIILVMSIPIYVLVIDYIWVSELDENNWLTLQHTKQKLKARAFSKDDIEKINQIWGELQPGVSITQFNISPSTKDSIYEVIRPNAFDTNDGEDRFRGLKSFVDINGQLYQITIETNVEESDETLLAIAMVTFFFFIVLIIGFIFLNRRIAAKSWLPFYQTLTALKSFDLSKEKTLSLSPTDIEEFQELNQSLKQLVENDLATYKLQKSFTENASHELQTPIAILKSRLDLLLQEKDITPEITEILSSLEAPLSRLSRVNKNLLLLAKVENKQYSDQEPLDLKAYIESSLALFEDYIDDKNLAITNQIENPLSVKSNSFLLETLLHNLLSNAIRHTLASGQIAIYLENRTLTFANSGNQALESSHLFERFSSATKDKVSSGLGLAIIKEIANKSGWLVAYQFEEGYHRFSVTF